MKINFLRNTNPDDNFILVFMQYDAVLSFQERDFFLIIQLTQYGLNQAGCEKIL